MAKILPLFATPVYINIFKDFDYINKLVDIIDGLEYNRKYGQPDQTKLTNILSDDRFVKVRDFIENSLKEYAASVLSTDKTISITQSWINKSEKGDSHIIHHHPNSIVSGVFYLQTVTGHPPIYFHSNQNDAIVVNSVERNAFTSDQYYLNTHAGNLLLFPSTLNHHVDENKIDTPRISLSFNTWIYGSIGSSLTLTNLIT